MAGSPDPKAGRIVDRHLTLCAPRGEGYQGQSPWLVSSPLWGHHLRQERRRPVGEIRRSRGGDVSMFILLRLSKSFGADPSFSTVFLSFVTQDIGGMPHMLTTGGEPVPEGR